MNKVKQLQIRVTAEEKAAIQQRAARAGVDVSKWILAQVLPPAEERFQSLCRDLVAPSDNRRYALAALNDFLAELSARELRRAVAEPPAVSLPDFEAAYVAAMVEQTVAMKRVPAPAWTQHVAPIDRPWFASTLKSLRLHLLTHSPAPFRRRNLFVDSTVGDRV
jgi:uncharacterized protein (DUF1778 family)